MPETVYSTNTNRISITLTILDEEHQTLTIRVSKVRINSISFIIK